MTVISTDASFIELNPKKVYINGVEYDFNASCVAYDMKNTFGIRKVGIGAKIDDDIEFQ